MPDLDFDRRRQPTGAYPDVRRALIVYWTVERERETGCSYREAVRRVRERPPIRSRGSVDYQYRKGAPYDRELAARWGPLYPTLRRETLAGAEV